MEANPNLTLTLTLTRQDMERGQDATACAHGRQGGPHAFIPLPVYLYTLMYRYLPYQGGPLPSRPA
eukprot:scaffold58824_cov45-Phaeocystis_antarctica.AAC.3